MLLHGSIQDTGVVAHAYIVGGSGAITDHICGIGSRGNGRGSGCHSQEGRRRTRPRSNVMMVMVVMMVVQQMMVIVQNVTD